MKMKKRAFKRPFAQMMGDGSGVPDGTPPMTAWERGAPRVLRGRLVRGKCGLCIRAGGQSG